MPTFIKLQHAYNYVDIESENKTVARDEILTPSKIQKVQTSKLISFFFIWGIQFFDTVTKLISVCEFKKSVCISVQNLFKNLLVRLSESFTYLELFSGVIDSYLETIYNTCIVQDEVHSIYQSQPSKKGKYDGQRKPPSCDNGYASKPCSKFILRHFFPKIEISKALTFSKVFNCL